MHNCVHSCVQVYKCTGLHQFQWFVQLQQQLIKTMESTSALMCVMSVAADRRVCVCVCLRAPPSWRAVRSAFARRPIGDGARLVVDILRDLVCHGRVAVRRRRRLVTATMTTTTTQQKRRRTRRRRRAARRRSQSPRRRRRRRRRPPPTPPFVGGGRRRRRRRRPSRGRYLRFRKRADPYVVRGIGRRPPFEPRRGPTLRASVRMTRPVAPRLGMTCRITISPLNH